MLVHKLIIFHLHYYLIHKPVIVSTTYTNTIQTLSFKNKFNKERNNENAENWKEEGENKRSNEAHVKWLAILFYVSIFGWMFLSIIIAIFIIFCIEMNRNKS